MRISDWSSDVCSSDLLDVTPNHRLYASYTRIFQPQNLLDRNLRQLDPLNGNAFEIGLKSSFFGDKLQTSIALFQIKQDNVGQPDRSEEHTSELQSLMRTSYAVFCSKKKTTAKHENTITKQTNK